MSDQEVMQLNRYEIEIQELRNLCAEAYQVVGSMDKPPVKALDNLNAAAAGEPLPHKTIL